MSPPAGEPQQHKQPSRKGKRAWRKNIDVSEVQTGLESLREEIRQGGPIAEKPSNELFVLDTAGSEEIRKKHKLTKPLKVDQILAERSAVPSVDGRKRSRSIPADGIYEPASKRTKKDWVSKKEVQRLKDGLNVQSYLNTQNAEDVSGTSHDLWAEGATTDQADETPSSEYIPRTRAKVAPETLQRAPTVMTANAKPIKAVPNPNGGTSYNPSFEEWDYLLTREGEKEVEAERARQQKAQVVAEKEARIAALAAVPERDIVSDGESAWEGFETEDEKTKLKQKRPERKTPAERNKLKRRKQAEQLANHEKRTGDKRRQAEQVVLAVAKNQDHARALTTDEPSSEDDADTEDTKIRRRKLGNAVIADKQLEVVLPDELQESLRRLKPEGNLMNDRFRTLLVNGKIESRKPIIQPKKKKIFTTEKWSYKDFGIQV